MAGLVSALRSGLDMVQIAMKFILVFNKQIKSASYYCIAGLFVLLLKRTVEKDLKYSLFHL